MEKKKVHLIKKAHHTTPDHPKTISWRQERDLLMTLGNDIAQVRKKEDLVRVFSSRLKEQFTFTHSVISLIDKRTQTYFPFLIDEDSMQIRHRKELPALLQMQFTLGDAFLRQLPEGVVNRAFLLAPIMDMPDVPAFIRVNYECGIRKALITRLEYKQETIGYVFMYAENVSNLAEDISDIMAAIAPLLASAVVNIILNEEMDNMQRQKTSLLTLSESVASVKQQTELFRAVTPQMKNLLESTELCIICFPDDRQASIVFSTDGTTIVFETYNRSTDPILERILKSEKPLNLPIRELTASKGMSHYINHLQDSGAIGLTGMRLKAGSFVIGCAFIGLTKQSSRASNLLLFQAVCAHLSLAVSNILVHEKLLRVNEEQAFLMEFSTNVAKVRSVDDLKHCVTEVLEKTMNVKLGMIQTLEEDQFHLTPFMYDASIYESTNSKAFFDKMVAIQVNVKEHYTSMVLASQDGIMFNAREESEKGNEYAKLWTATGFRNMYALPLRTGNKTIGTIWLHANKLSRSLLQGIVSEISIAIDNVLANEKLLNYKKQLEVENNYLKEQIKTIYDFSEIIGNGPAMQAVFNLVSLVAETNSTVLLTGETGTGKELIARALHVRSPRRDRAMVKVNCAALPANLIESELFGHEKGAFTGAIDKRLGKFELADKGTLFLDEIGEMPVETQVKLLRVLQEQEIERVGGQRTIRVDVRIIAATNRILEEEVKAGKFRADLFYRLNVFPITLPPLRERVEDIPILAQYFLEKYSQSTGKKQLSFSDSCIRKLSAYRWPGNVRELQHLIERTVLLTTTSTIQDVELPAGSVAVDDGAPQQIRSLENNERNHILTILRQCHGKISGKNGAADVLNIPATTLHSKMKKLGISKRDYLACFSALTSASFCTLFS